MRSMVQFFKCQPINQHYTILKFPTYIRICELCIDHTMYVFCTCTSPWLSVGPLHMKIQSFESMFHATRTKLSKNLTSHSIHHLFILYPLDGFCISHTYSMFNSFFQTFMLSQSRQSLSLLYHRIIFQYQKVMHCCVYQQTRMMVYRYHRNHDHQLLNNVIRVVAINRKEFYDASKNYSKTNLSFINSNWLCSQEPISETFPDAPFF